MMPTGALGKDCTAQSSTENVSFSVAEGAREDAPTAATVYRSLDADDVHAAATTEYLADGPIDPTRVACALGSACLKLRAEGTVDLELTAAVAHFITLVEQAQSDPDPARRACLRESPAIRRFCDSVLGSRSQWQSPQTTACEELAQQDPPQPHAHTEQEEPQAEPAESIWAYVTRQVQHETAMIEQENAQLRLLILQMLLIGKGLPNHENCSQVVEAWLRQLDGWTAED
eukprot:gnl/TRDRNA2_/TRDRNA2_64892_c0_seq1.p1 gnl/TRDRNA2_/TRDRNA2_64892_c0~~gnl/TRDRNA2_/TRDRNA2_64892_c0_seq1.p1  ORF type:complete len:230 (-),score=23.98 gnl/TRDRNA2_/TRDRNA2_64892_c0_seq1:38-727(-)